MQRRPLEINVCKLKLFSQQASHTKRSQLILVSPIVKSDTLLRTRSHQKSAKVVLPRYLRMRLKKSSNGFALLEQIDVLLGSRFLQFLIFTLDIIVSAMLYARQASLDELLAANLPFLKTIVLHVCDLLSNTLVGLWINGKTYCGVMRLG